MAYLETTQDQQARRYHLNDSPLVVGRSRTCDLVLDGASVSRRHAEIVHDGERYFVKDLKSRRGTLVNGSPVQDPMPLEENDAISICDHLLIFHQGTEDSEATDNQWVLSSGDSYQNTVIMSTLDMRASTAIPEVRPEAKLRAVLEITRRLHKTLMVDELLPKVLETLFGIFPQAAAGFILLRDDSTGEFVPKAVKNMESDDGEIRISRTIVDQALERRQGILLADAMSDADYQHSHSISNLGLRSILCVPLLNQADEALGVLQIHNEQGGRAFAQDDLEVLVSVGTTTAMALDNAKFHERQMAQDRVMRELQLARDVQGRFLPANDPDVPGYSFYSHYAAAYTVGGDFYSYVELPENRVAIAIGDVSGKGMSAAMLMARVSSDVRFALLGSPDAAAAMGSVNVTLGAAGIEEKFVTSVLMVLDYKNHTITLANAGHLYPLLRHADGNIEMLGEDISGFPLNVDTDPSYRYKQIVATLEPRSTVLLYTDGVSDSQRADGQRYGEERLKERFSASFADAPAAGETMIEDVWSFCDGHPQVDDITLICFGRKSAS